MKIAFWKMHGAANDFILVDDRQQAFPAGDSTWIARVAGRRTGIGSDGVILIQPSEVADFRMRFFNPDGGEVEMCGNGARCVARLANEIGAAPEEMTIDTVAGVLRAEARGGQVLLHMTTPKDWAMDQQLTLDGATIDYHFVNSGVPHVVVEVPDLDAIDVQQLGSGIRCHEAFQPAGTNANFVQITGSDSLRIRTYERGVEAETLACGTGIVAAGLVMGRAGKIENPVRITPTSGDELEVNFSLGDDSAGDVTLLGPAEHVYTGELEYTAAP